MIVNPSITSLQATAARSFEHQVGRVKSTTHGIML
jgi:hypothetical protein